MELHHRKIDFVNDREYILERHCRINYECECPWKRKMSYDEYRAEWFGLKNQTEAFYGALTDSTADKRTIAEIIFNEQGEIVGYLWVPFSEDTESGFCFADVQDIYVEDGFRALGIATNLMNYAESNARKNGATVIRSGTGCENKNSFALHEKLGYYQYRYEFEKML